MSTHTIQLHWQRLEQAFSDRRYRAEYQRLHEVAHAARFIARSARTEILCVPVVAQER
jgi:hypothetical protein